MGAAAIPDAWIRNGQKRVNGSSGVKRSLDGFRKSAGGQGWLPAGLDMCPRKKCGVEGQKGGIHWGFRISYATFYLPATSS